MCWAAATLLRAKRERVRIIFTKMADEAMS
jgi:hypothetical protein